jgi:transposase
MRFYTKQHKYYCGIDLHTKKMYVCILDSEGKIRLHQNIRTDPESFLQILTPFREDVAVAVECMFTWYWIADLCVQQNIPFVLGHALYMKAIHGGKAKNDKIDSHKIATLLRGGMLPQAYVYPARMRATRDLLRRRNHCVDGRDQSDHDGRRGDRRWEAFEDGQYGGGDGHSLSDEQFTDLGLHQDEPSVVEEVGGSGEDSEGEELSEAGEEE